MPSPCPKCRLFSLSLIHIFTASAMRACIFYGDGLFLSTTYKPVMSPESSNSPFKDIKNEIAKILLKDVSFPAHHYWKIFERIIAENLDMTEIRNSLLTDFKSHFAACIEKTQNEENLHQKLNNMASNLSRSTPAKLKPICQHILTSWTHGSVDSARFSTA